MKKSFLLNKCTCALACACMAFILSACEHKELYTDDSLGVNVDVVFDWQLSPDANPERMSIYLFPKGGETSWRYDFSNMKGGSIRLPEGVYDVLCLNSDSEVALYRNINRWETLEVSTRETTLFASRSSSIPRAEGTLDERVVWTPDPLWCSSASDFTVESSTGNNSIMLLPENVIQTYTLVISNVENVKYSSQFIASISSMAGGIHPADKTLSDEKVTIPFELVVDEEHNLITGTFQTYGSNMDDESVHQLMIYAIMKNGEKYFYTFDVTEQLHQASETGELKIEIDKLPLPKPIVNGGGFSPELNRWGAVDVDITM